MHLQMKLYFVKHRDEKSFIVHEIEKRTAVTGQQFKRFVYVTPHYGEHLAGFLVHGPCFEASKNSCVARGRMMWAVKSPRDVRERWPEWWHNRRHVSKTV